MKKESEERNYDSGSRCRLWFERCLEEDDGKKEKRSMEEKK